MADVDSVANGIRAAERGCEWVGTTLYGYTEETQSQKPPGLELLPDLRHQLKTSVRLICEGGIASPSAARTALEAGADNVVVGTAITGWTCRWPLIAKGWPADHIIPGMPMPPIPPMPGMPIPPMPPIPPMGSPPPSGAGASGSGLSAITTSVVISSEAMETES